MARANMDALRAGSVAARSFLPPVDGDGADQPEDRPDQRMAEERSLGDRDELARDGGDEEGRVDQGVVVVGHDDERAARGDVLEPDDLDPVIEDREQQARECADGEVDHRVPVPGTYVSVIVSPERLHELPLLQVAQEAQADGLRLVGQS